MKTLVLGASTNPNRYSYLATERLLRAGHEVVLVGNREGQLFGQPILTGAPLRDDIDTVTLYLGARNQEPYLDYLTEQLMPRRIIFNPGTENPVLIQRARAAGIETELACTLVMLGAQTY